MKTEKKILIKLQELPTEEQEKLLQQIDSWIGEWEHSQVDSIERAVDTVEHTWARLTLDPQILRRVAEDPELDYEID